jgi:hypothetical protein
VRLGLLLGALAVTGCNSAAPPVTVQQLLAQCDAYKGKPIRLAGYLGECAGYECHLFADKAALAAFNDAWKAELAAEREVNRGADPKDPKFAGLWERANALWPVGVGGGEAFDRKAGPFQNSYVVITGTVAKDTCTGAGGTDRSAGIEPTDIRAWTMSEGAPANTK